MVLRPAIVWAVSWQFEGASECAKPQLQRKSAKDAKLRGKFKAVSSSEAMTQSDVYKGNAKRTVGWWTTANFLGRGSLRPSRSSGGLPAQRRGLTATLAGSAGALPELGARTLGHTDAMITLKHYIPEGASQTAERERGLEVLTQRHQHSSPPC